MRLDAILRVAAKMVLPFIFVFGLYVLFHGDFGPGGGFQAGIIIAAAVFLHAIIFGLGQTMRIVPPIIVEIMVPLGVLVFAGVGVAAMMTGANYLDYSYLAHDRIHGQEWGVFLVEVGVLITVSGTMIVIFYAVAGRDRR